MAASSSTSDQPIVNGEKDSLLAAVNMEKDEAKVADKNGPLAVAAKDTAMAPEKGFSKYFLNPMLSQMEDAVSKNNDILDEINRRMAADSKARMRANLSTHIPGPLKGEGQKMEAIMKQLESLIIYEDYDAEKEIQSEARLQELDTHGKAATTAHSLMAYVSTLSPDHLKNFTNRIVSDCQLWLSRLFRFQDSNAFYHEEDMDGIVKICRLALNQKYPKYAAEGFEALFSRPPVIYLSAAAKPDLGQYICTQLGLPLSCICSVPCNTMFGASQKMDVAILEKLIQDDSAAAKTPLLLIGYAGTPAVGHVDNLQRLQDICKKNEIWLHVMGNSLATLVLFSVPTSVQSAKSGDSMTVNIGRWLGISCLPNATLYKTSEPALMHAAGLSTFNSHIKLTCLPLWIVLQSIGHEGIVKRVKKSCNLAKVLSEKLVNMSTLKIVSKEAKPKSTKENLTVGDLISKAISALVVFEIMNPTIVFKYTEDTSITATEVAPYAMEESTEEREEREIKQTYYNALNVWLGESLTKGNPSVRVDIVDVEKDGICIRYSPLENAQVLGTTPENIDAFVEHLKTQISILDSTVLKRERFRGFVRDQENLKLIEDNWAGLGAVQYIPDAWQDKLEILPDAGRNEINNLNAELVHRLKAMDPAFSMGQTENEMVCVRFGLINPETYVEELVAMVCTEGKEVEESSKFLETMSELIRTGIEQANKDLQQENKDRLVQEGALRQVPLVGSLINWLSPTHTDGMKGRTFNLTSGKITSTETIYKYHMQIQEEPLSPGKSPRSRDSSRKSSSSSLTSREANMKTSPQVNGIATPPATMQSGKKVDTGVEIAKEVKASSESSAKSADASPDLE